jgi:hypothetical protein
MRLTDLEPKWLERGGVRVGFIFRNPVRAKWWTSCFFDPTPDEEQERLIAALLGPDPMCQQCNPDCGWKIVDGKPETADFASISVTPSLNGGPGFWHGHITNGEIK